MTEQMINNRKVEFGINNAIGWMAPDGSFYYTLNMEHLSMAREIAKIFYNESDGDTSLYRHRWLSIHPYGICEDYLFSWKGHLTEEQKSIIKPFVELYQNYIAKLTKYDLFDELEIEYDRTNESTFAYLSQVPHQELKEDKNDDSDNKFIEDEDNDDYSDENFE